MEKTTAERILKLFEYADKIRCEKSEYGDDYIFHAKINIPCDKIDELKKLCSQTSKDENGIKMNKLITEERCALLRKRKSEIETELLTLQEQDNQDVIPKEEK